MFKAAITLAMDALSSIRAATTGGIPIGATSKPQNTAYFRNDLRIGPGQRTVFSASLEDRSKYIPHQGVKERARRASIG